MATRKRKTRRLRASRMHGWGRSGQHRDSGMQGGHGNAGWKRHRWSSVIRYGWVIAEKGFTPVHKQNDHVINVGELGLSIDRFLEQGQAREVGNRIELDLGQLGYTKLLGDGKIYRPVKITVNKATEKAMEKIGQAGGEVVVSKKEETAVEKETETPVKTKPSAKGKPTPKVVKG